MDVEKILSEIADSYIRIYDIKHSVEYADRSEAGDDKLWYAVESIYEDIAILNESLENVGYQVDDGIIENLENMAEVQNYISVNDILESTKIDGINDIKYGVVFESVKSGKIKTQVVYIYLDKDYSGREQTFRQDMIMACMSIAEFFGQHFRKIKEWKKCQ